MVIILDMGYGSYKECLMKAYILSLGLMRGKQMKWDEYFVENSLPDWLKICLSCKHCYQKEDDAEMVYCRCKNGECHYKKECD